ncbi:hypothetical protein ACPOL_1861 [Acidisarcina polymorpha]|uniref:Uncharacterized protein n=1 Tax=Acidisarcina polymorpha TaxID=2211140 RepID=A0A2Z5FWJ7_9BACT|nr:hypothetical protein ACPOL_1861 [Acidisarcina polymorpha]
MNQCTETLKRARKPDCLTKSLDGTASEITRQAGTIASYS